MPLTNTNALLDQIIGLDWQPGTAPRGRLGQLNASQASLRQYFAELTLGLDAITNNIRNLIRIKQELEISLRRSQEELEASIIRIRQLDDEIARSGREKNLLTGELADAEEKIQVTQNEINTLEQKLTAINQTIQEVQIGLEQDKPQLDKVESINNSMRNDLGSNFESWSPTQQVGGKRKSKKGRKHRKRSVKKYKRKGRYNKKGGYVYTLRKKGKNKSFRKDRK
tara:strand:+ start:12 stop:686 length:675 start_codon:yes stop_codon:yes gene_type:complete